MGVHVHIEAITLGDPQYLDGMAYPFFIVETRAFGLNSFPREDVSNGIVSVPPQPCEVDVGIVFCKRPLVEANIVAVKEVINNLRGLVKRLAWILGVGCDVDAAEDDLTPGGIDKLAVFDLEAERGHGHLGGGDQEAVGNT